MKAKLRKERERLSRSDRQQARLVFVRPVELSVVALFAGMWIGQYLRRRLSEDKFRRWVFAFLVIVGANLIRKGFF